MAAHLETCLKFHGWILVNIINEYNINMPACVGCNNTLCSVKVEHAVLCCSAE